MPGISALLLSLFLYKRTAMYLDYWGVEEPPFENVPNKSIFFRSPQHDEAMIRLLYAVEHKKGVAMLTGDVGSGKTTVTRALMSRLTKDRFDFKLISNPALGPLDLIRAILMKFGEDAESDSKTVLLGQLNNRLLQNYEQNISTVLAFDEAHVIVDSGTLDELRMLLNMQSDDQFLITLVLIGQPPLLKTISGLQPLKERIGIKYHLDPLDIQNTMRYILFRLKSAGATRGIFTKEAIYAIFEYSQGIPLRINNICDRSLLIGLMNGTKNVGSKIVSEAIEDLR